MPAAVASLAPVPSPQSFHAAFVQDLAPRSCAERFFADQAARAAAALQQLTPDPSPTLTTEHRLSALLSRALRELRLLQSDRHKREQHTEPAPAPDARISQQNDAATVNRKDVGSASANAKPLTNPPAPPNHTAPELPRLIAIPAATEFNPSPQPPPKNHLSPFGDILATAPSAAAHAILQQRRRNHQSTPFTTALTPSS